MPVESEPTEILFTRGLLGIGLFILLALAEFTGVNCLGSLLGESWTLSWAPRLTLGEGGGGVVPLLKLAACSDMIREMFLRRLSWVVPWWELLLDEILKVCCRLRVILSL